MKEAEKIIEDISKEFKAKEKEIGKGIMEGVTELREQQNEQNTLMKCPKCGKGDLRIMYSRKTRSQFVACSAYPECRNTYNVPPNSYIKKADKTCPDCGFPLLISLKKGKRPWEFCINPECPDNKKRREEWERKNGRKIGQGVVVEGGSEEESKEKIGSRVVEGDSEEGEKKEESDESGK